MDGVDPAGGSRELAQLIDRYGEFLIPDLKTHYGIDLRDLFSEENPMSPSFVLLHVKHLPMGSSFVAEMRGGQVFRDWNIDRYLRVAEVNTLKALLYVYLASHVDPKKTKVAQPDPWPIPDAKVKTKQSPKPGSFAAIALARLAAVKKLKEGGVV